jgi:hypothetical protein
MAGRGEVQFNPQQPQSLCSPSVYFSGRKFHAGSAVKPRKSFAAKAHDSAVIHQNPELAIFTTFGKSNAAKIT